jgi:Mrp family chromosome partitioning ATPase
MGDIMSDNRTSIRLELRASTDAPLREIDTAAAEAIATSGAIVEAGHHGRLKNASKFAAISTTRERPPFQLDPDLVMLFYSIDAMRSDDEAFVLQFIAATPGEGTTTMAWGFAVAAALERSQPVLIISCDNQEAAGAVPTLIDAARDRGAIEEAIQPVEPMKRLFQARLSSTANPLLEIDGADLRELFAELKDTFSVIVLDCSAATIASDSLAISRYCDGTALVVRADHARRQVINWTKSSIERFGGNVIGTVFNDRKKYIPDWIYRRL